ncbi:MAG: molybdopterin molybdotransferase MoeA [Methanobrevibacter sp.]|jgi:molybdopterin molybdotransferase|nr:molybdopterin molybdotransferase MoeA [Candidatus Methanovirga aequatorialis]
MFLSEFISIEDAFKIIGSNQVVNDYETISLDHAYLRALGEDAYSYHDSPPFDKSAMDGYALMSKDTFGASLNNPKYVVLIDEIGAGDLSEKEIRDGEAIKIATGAPIPKGADAVLMEEFTVLNGNNLEIHSQITPMENIAPKGEDIKREDRILSKGTLLKPAELGLIASSGHDKVKVYKKPKIKLITTGNELVKPSKRIKKAQIINSNRYTISAMIKSVGGLVEVEHCKDTKDEVKIAILKASNEYDMILTTGGTAISEGDVVVDVVKLIGEVLIHGVAIRPGKPFGFGKLENTPIFMLSGNPSAAISQFDIFVRKYIFEIQGLEYNPPILRRESKVKIPSTLGRTDYIKVSSDDEYVNYSLNKGSGIIHSMVAGNGYLIIDENNEGIKKGDVANVILFRSMELS